jgi:hypothetical protein
LQLTVLLQHAAGKRTLKRRKPQRLLPLEPKYQLHDAGAQAAIAIEEQNVVSLQIHAPHYPDSVRQHDVGRTRVT